MNRKSLLLLVYLTSLFFYTYGQNSKRVLFIGNSYTGTNNLPQMVANVSLSAGDTVFFDSNTPGGVTFQGHASNATSLNKISAGNWNYVVLQEQSQRPAFSNGQVQNEVFTYARKLDSLVNAHNPCAETIFYMTWGYKTGDASNCAAWPPICTYRGMDSMINLRYMQMAEDNRAIVSPVGAVRKYFRENYPSVELYTSDGSHPTVEGTYIAACCFYTTIFRKDPSLITYNGSVNPTIAANMRNAVKLIVYNALSDWFIGEYDDELPMAEASFTVNAGQVSFVNQSQNASGYSWSFGDGHTSTDENPVHAYGAPGTYTVSLTATGCGNSDVTTFTVTVETLHMDDAYLPMVKAVYPNPASRTLTIETAGAKEVLLEVIDNVGRQVNMGYAYNGNTITLDCSAYTPGIYFIRLHADGKIYSTKFVKE